MRSSYTSQADFLEDLGRQGWRFQDIICSKANHPDLEALNVDQFFSIWKDVF